MTPGPLAPLLARLGEVAAVALAAAMAVASFSADGEAYLFPRLVSATMLALCVAMLARSLGRPPAAMPAGTARRVAPGFAIVAGYAAVAETAGFYLASVAAFFLVVAVYGTPRWGARAVAIRVAVTAAFILAMHLVFSRLLKVQIPGGFLG